MWFLMNAACLPASGCPEEDPRYALPCTKVPVIHSKGCRDGGGVDRGLPSSSPGAVIASSKIPAPSKLRTAPKCAKGEVEVGFAGQGRRCHLGGATTAVATTSISLRRRFDASA